MNRSTYCLEHLTCHIKLSLFCLLLCLLCLRDVVLRVLVPQQAALRLLALAPHLPAPDDLLHVAKHGVRPLHHVLPLPERAHILNEMRRRVNELPRGLQYGRYPRVVELADPDDSRRGRLDGGDGFVVLVRVHDADVEPLLGSHVGGGAGRQQRTKPPP